MQRLHDLYMKAMSDCNFMQGARITDEDFFRGEAIIWIDWEEIFQLYHQGLGAGDTPTRPYKRFLGAVDAPTRP